jgi:antitoxin HicB
VKIEEYMALPYRVVIRDEGEHGWSAELPELPGCVGAADSRAELDAMVDDAKRAWLESALRHGDEIPLPASQRETSGTRAS